jgi:MATE family multidrug resistance protein
MSSHIQKFDSSPIGVRRVFALAWPICVSMLSMTAMGIVDTMLVARLGTAALAAVGLSVTISFVALAFGHGVLHGIKVVASQRIGAGDHDAAERLAWQTLWMAAFIGLPVAALALVAPLIASFVAPSADVAWITAIHLTIRLLGAPVMFTMVGLSSYLQARERTRITMVATVLSNAIAIGADLALVFGWGPFPALGAPGAAVASVIAWSVGSLVQLGPVIPILRRTSSRPDPALLREVWRMGSPMGVQFALDVASFAVFTTVLARVGEAHLAAHVITIRIISVSFLPGNAIAEAGSVLVGQAVGAGRHDRAREAWLASLRLAIGVMLVGGLGFVLFPDLLVSGFRAEPGVAVIAHQLLRIAALFQLFDAIATVSFGALTGAGDTRFTMVYNGLVAWIVKLPLAIVLAVPLGLGAPGAWLGLTLEIVVLAGISVWRITSGRWLAAPEVAPAPEAALAA